VSSRRRVCAGLGLTLAATVGLRARPAAADGIKVELSTKVAQGQRPKVRLVATEPLQGLRVELNRGDGKLVTSAAASLGAGAAHELLLPGDAGRQHYEGRVTFTARGQAQESRLEFDAIVAPPLQAQIDKAKVNLADRRLEARLSRPAGKVLVRVLGATSAQVIAEVEHDFTGQEAGAPLVVTWPAPSPPEDVGRIELRLADVDDFFTGVALSPWSVHIPHEEVNFATDSAAIAAAEEPKLGASLKLIADALGKHKSLGPIRLYVAGHTDTQGAAAYNVKLSQRRSQAIAAWFRKKGLRIPIFHEGFGEHAPLVATPDEKDEPRNRRVDYILAIEDPALKATAFRAAWKRLP
jgi:outer membrane protein OmpA-like peptidoglycan-associated protein